MIKENKEKQVLQWHPAFYAGIQIEFSEEREKLIFENEHQLGTKPKEIDILIIKKNSEEKIHKNIGRIFRKHNIVEYKSPDDYLSVDDYYKGCGYACFYKSDVAQVDAIKAEDITVTFVCKRRPNKLFRHLTNDRCLAVKKQEEGIYYIEGDLFPVQLLLTAELSQESNLWLSNLTNDLRQVEIVSKLLKEYAKNKKNNLYSAVMDIIVRANREKFEEEKEMCDALLELMKDELDACKAAGVQEGRQVGLQEGIKALIEDNLEEGVSEQRIIEKLQKRFDLTEEQAKKYYDKCKETINESITD